MKGHKLLFFAIASFIAVAVAATAIVMFRDEIVECFVSMQQKLEAKRKSVFKRGCCGSGDEYTDYADV